MRSASCGTIRQGYPCLIVPRTVPAPSNNTTDSVILMVSPQKTRIRVICSRGHLYAQEVWYEWDKSRKRGVTHVIRTLGPLSPTRKPVVGEGRLTPQVIRQLIIRKGGEHSQGEQNLRATNVAQGLVPGPIDSLQLTESTPPVRPTRVPMQFTGSVGLGEFDEHILEIVRNSEGPATRDSVTKIAQRSGINPPSQQLPLRRHVGFSLFRLLKKGRIVRAGAGGRGNPYQYSIALEPSSA